MKGIADIKNPQCVLPRQKGGQEELVQVRSFVACVETSVVEV